MKQKQAVLEKFNMKGAFCGTQHLYNELIQWGRSEREDKSELRGSIYGLGYSVCDMPYMGWQGEELEKEVGKIHAVIHAYKAFLSIVEDVLGIKAEYPDDDLNDFDEVRYQILDTKSGIGE